MPKAIVTEENAPSAVMDEVVERLDHAMVKVVANKGGPGPDGVTVGMLRVQWPTIVAKLRAELLDGTYLPGVIRRAMIPKLAAGSVDSGSRTWSIGW